MRCSLSVTPSQPSPAAGVQCDAHIWDDGLGWGWACSSPLRGWGGLQKGPVSRLAFLLGLTLRTRRPPGSSYLRSLEDAVLLETITVWWPGPRHSPRGIYPWVTGTVLWVNVMEGKGAALLFGRSAHVPALGWVGNVQHCPWDGLCHCPHSTDREPETRGRDVPSLTARALFLSCSDREVDLRTI